MFKSIKLKIKRTIYKKNDVDGLKEDKKEFIKNKLILKTQQRFKRERYNVINKTALSSDDDKRM